MPESIKFPLEVDEDWPPVPVECLPFEKESGGLRLLAAPLFVKDLSVGDVIAVELDQEGFASEWSHVHRSNNTTVWLLRTRANDGIAAILEKLREIGCNTVSLQDFGCYAVDVPESLEISKVDAIFDARDANVLAVTFPSMRHPE